MSEDYAVFVRPDEPSCATLRAQRDELARLLERALCFVAAEDLVFEARALIASIKEQGDG